VNCCTVLGGVRQAGRLEIAGGDLYCDAAVSAAAPRRPETQAQGNRQKVGGGKSHAEPLPEVNCGGASAPEGERQTGRLSRARLKDWLLQRARASRSAHKASAP
jgi:hypothetical protein